MSKEGIELLIKQAEAIDNDQAEQVKQADPDFQSAADIRKECEERALWILGGFHMLVSELKPEAAQIVLTDPKLEDGHKKLTDVLVKYPGAGVPPWMEKFLAYSEEFKCGLFFAGVCYGIYKEDEKIQAEKEAKNENGEEVKDEKS